VVEAILTPAEVQTVRTFFPHARECRDCQVAAPPRDELVADRMRARIKARAAELCGTV